MKHTLFVILITLIVGCETLQISKSPPPPEVESKVITLDDGTQVTREKEYRWVRIDEDPQVREVVNSIDTIGQFTPWGDMITASVAGILAGAGGLGVYRKVRVPKQP